MKNLKIIIGAIFASVFILFLQEELVIQGAGLVRISDTNLEASVNKVLNLDDEMKFSVETIQSEFPPSPALKFAIILSALLVCGYLVFILQVIINLIRDIRNKASLNGRNVDRLKQISWLIILAPILKVGLNTVYLMIIGSQYDLPPELIFSWHGDFDLVPVAIGLLLYAIAIAFGEGLKMKEEQELTI